LYSKLNNLDAEGIQAVVPYKKQLDEFFKNPAENQSPNVKNELLISSLYFFIPIRFIMELMQKIC